MPFPAMISLLVYASNLFSFTGLLLLKAFLVPCSSSLMLEKQNKVKKKDFLTMHMSPCCSSKETFLKRGQCHSRKIFMLPLPQYLTNFPSSASTDVLCYDLVLCIFLMHFLSLNLNLLMSYDENKNKQLHYNYTEGPLKLNCNLKMFRNDDRNTDHRKWLERCLLIRGNE